MDALHRTLIGPLAIVCATLVLGSSAAFALPLQPGAPIDVEADAFVVDLEKQRAQWTGNVVARQNGHVIEASALTIVLTSTRTHAESSPTNSEATDANPAPVVIEAGRFGYRQSYGEFTSSGGTVIIRGDSRIESDTLIYALDRRQARAGADADGRVRVTLTMAEDSPVRFETAALMTGAQ